MIHGLALAIALDLRFRRALPILKAGGDPGERDPAAALTDGAALVTLLDVTRLARVLRF